jgi:ATP-binding cassette subfamily B multidrug efflux pump
MFLNLLFRPLRIIADKFNVLQMGMIAAERVFKVMDNDDVTIDKGDHVTGKIKGGIEFNRCILCL